MFGIFRKKADIMWLIAGLGNPGSKYRDNRHNIGFMALDYIADANHAGAFKKKFDGEWTDLVLQSHKCGLLKPLTYMNNSGLAVGKAAKFYKIPADKVIVIHDELDLEFGRIRVKQGGGNGGHNGLKSIDAHLGSPDYHRIRIGIGHPGDKTKVTGYVLGDFSKEEKGKLDDSLERCAQELERILNS